MIRMGEQRNAISRWFGERKAVRLMLFAALLALCVIHSAAIVSGLLFLLNAARPIIIGAAIAYVLEIVTGRLERILFPKTTRKWLIKARRPIAVALGMIAVISLLVLLIYIVIPGLTEAVTLLANEMPGYFNSAKEWVLEVSTGIPALRDAVEPLNFDWVSIQERVVNWIFGSGEARGILSSTLSVVGAVSGTLADLFISLIFAMFVLAGKDTLRRQFSRLLATAFKPRKRERVTHILSTANRSFSGFIVGQTLYGLISGVSTWIGMVIFHMPYALMVGVLCGTLIIIPIIGGYLGVILGTFLVFTAAPSMAIWSLLFIAVLQTVEGNIIYPRLIGSSLGLPGMWVLAAVSIGGGIGGMAGMLIAVPLAATCYVLVKEWVAKKEKDEETGPANEAGPDGKTLAPAAEGNGTQAADPS